MKKISIWRAFLTVLYRINRTGKYFCAICENKTSGFIPYRINSKNMPPLMKAVNIVGSNIDLFECPRCGCHDRERHLYLYLKKTDLLQNLKNKNVLHFAPEKHLSKKIQSATPQRYIKCDLYPASQDVLKVDMLDIPFENETFDFLFANHVLEHVSDDIAALTEIYRVLKPGGYAILQTPYSSKIHITWSDAGIDTYEARLQAYGQEDHVRLYGLDIFKRFEITGLVSHIKLHREELPEVDRVRFGINDEEPLFLFRKPEAKRA